MFQDRINYKGDIKHLMDLVCEDYGIGKYKSHKVIELGYEDFNLILETTTSKYFVKTFAAFRASEDITRYVDMMLVVIEARVAHPKLLKSKQGYSSHYEIDSAKVDLCLMEYIPEGNLYQTEYKLSEAEKRFIVSQSAIINKIKLDIPEVYDSWAIVNIVKEFEETKAKFTPGQLELLEPVIKNFSKNVDLSKLPRSFVHGDIIKTNVIKSGSKIYILDFSVANNYPRIQELAVLLCNILFDKNSKEQNRADYNLAIEEYQKYTKLDSYELEVLPIYVEAAHAMHVIGPVKARSEGFDTKENEYWLGQGVSGLRESINLY